ncbi:MAG: biosynthetic-type acetolactate synthase large subunit [Fusobacterium sp.]|nr:biosynthetic-type acetolactate synthase large subunit [Fusobacterium sp.]
MAMQVTTKTLTGAKILVETLKNIGVDTIFGYPGGIVLKVYDELFAQNEIKHILSRHEQASVHEAEGYSRTSGKAGVVLVTSGPGATNIVTGLANAYLDGYPLVVLTGQVSKELIGKDAFQEVDIVDITRPCTKKAFQVTDVRELEKTLVEAFSTALSGKKGPVVVDLAKNIFTETAEFEGLKLSVAQPNSEFDKISDILSLLNDAKHPVIVAGGGVVHSGAAKELAQFAQMTNIPVVSTMMGLGAFSQENPLYFGMIGLFGSFSANQILRESDLIISLGARFNDRISCCFPNGELERNLIQIDINENEISRVLNARLGVVGDIKEILSAIYVEKNFIGWANEAQILKSRNRKPEKKSEKLHSFEVIEAVNKFSGARNLIVTTEVGQHQLWAAKGYKFDHAGQFVTSGGSGTMGFGFPAAIGASIAQNGAPVICITGDGSFQMNLQELATCVEYGLPVKILVLNNGYLGMVRQLQERMCEKRYSQTQIHNPDFVGVAKAYGVEALRVENLSEINHALEKCFASSGPFLIDFVVEPMEVV